MTTPKEDKPVYIPATLEDVARGVVAIRKALDKPNEAMRELVEEFRRLAVEASQKDDGSRAHALRQAAQMLEERLNG